MIEYLAPKNTYKKEEKEHPNNSPRELLPPKRNPNSEIESKVANFLLERILSAKSQVAQIENSRTAGKCRVNEAMNPYELEGKMAIQMFLLLLTNAPVNRL